MKVNWLVVVVATALSGIALAQQDSLPQSTTPHATIVTSGEIGAVVERTPAGALSDSTLSVVPIESSYNVGVAVVRRSPIDGRIPTDALVHDAVTEVYQIIEGDGILVTGGTLDGAKPVTDAQILSEIGPTSAGERIGGGTRTHVGPGDIVIIPPHTPHGFVEINSKRIVYTIIRIDPKQVLALRNKPS